MGTSKLFSKNKLNPVKGAIIEIGSINKWPRVTKTMPLKDLIALKVKTVEKLKSLLSSLTGLKDINLVTTKEIVEKIEAYQYNLTIFKQLNAIANVGNPSEDMYGINACIFQSSDLHVLGRALSSLASKSILLESSDTRDRTLTRDYLYDKIRANKQIIDNHHRIQADYNRKITVTVEYLDIK